MPAEDYASGASALRARPSPAILLSSHSKATFVHYAHETLVIADSAHACGGCGAMHFIFINRGGPTLCVGCSQRVLRTGIEPAANSQQQGARA